MKDECTERSDQAIFIFKDKKGGPSTLTLKNLDRIMSEKIVVDGCEIIDDTQKKCDFLLLAKGEEMYIELKGQNIKEAIRQLKNTIRLLSKNSAKHPKRAYIVANKRCPMAGADIQGFEYKFRKDYNAKLKIKTTPFEDTY